METRGALSKLSKLASIPKLASPKDRKELKEENLNNLENNQNKMNLCDALNFVQVFEEHAEENFHLFVSQVETALSFIGEKNESDLVRAICN